MKRADDIIKSLCRPVLVVALLAGLLLGCDRAPRKSKAGKEDGKELKEETAVKGEINIGIDITMEPVLKQVLDAYHIDYPDATIHPWYKTEGELVQDLLEDSVRMVFISRDLTKAEKGVVLKDQIHTTATLVARDAIVAVLHPENPMDSIQMKNLGRLMRGEAKTWKDVGGAVADTVHLVFDAPQSSTVRMLRDQFLNGGTQLPRNAFQAHDQDKVVEYVSQDKNAIGFIGYCLVSDRDEPKAQDILSKVKLARLDAADTSDAPGYFIRPYQNEIALGRYPFSRPIYAVSREHFTGLGTGFVSFFAGEIGQRILLKAGLVPEFMPPRVVVLPEKED